MSVVFDPLSAAFRRDREGVGRLAGRGSCDLMAEYASRLPSPVGGELLGVPDDLLAECPAVRGG